MSVLAKPHDPTGFAELEQLDAMEALLLKRPYTNTQLAAHLGVPLSLVPKMRARVESRWKIRQRTKLQDRRRLRIRQLEDLYERAVEDYERSQRQEIGMIKKLVLVECNLCEGTGALRNDFCPSCDGEGKLVSEVVEREYVAVPGNPAFLQNAQKILGELSKIEGIVAPDHKEVNQHMTINSTVLSANFVSPDNPFKEASTEDLHRALAALHNLKQSQSTSLTEVTVVDGTVVDGKSTE